MWNVERAIHKLRGAGKQRETKMIKYQALSTYLICDFIRFLFKIKGIEWFEFVHYTFHIP